MTGAMRSITLALVVTLSASAVAQPGTPAEPAPPGRAPVDPGVERLAKIARTAARDGHCDVALEYIEVVRTQAPAYLAEVAMDPYLAGCLAGTPLVAPAPASATPAMGVEVSVEADVEPCRRLALYAEPSLFVLRGSTFRSAAGSTSGGDQSTLFHRVAAGGQVRPCSRLPKLVGHIGATGVVSARVSGFGVDAELDYDVAPAIRVGVRVGVEVSLYKDRLASIGARFRVSDVFFVGIDAYHTKDGPFTNHGVMFGLGLQGGVGRWAVVGDAILFAAAVALIVLAPAD